MERLIRMHKELPEIAGEVSRSLRFTPAELVMDHTWCIHSALFIYNLAAELREVHFRGTCLIGVIEVF
jgi:hypothetical protein